MHNPLPCTPAENPGRTISGLFGDSRKRFAVASSSEPAEPSTPARQPPVHLFQICYVNYHTSGFPSSSGRISHSLHVAYVPFAGPAIPLPTRTLQRFANLYGKCNQKFMCGDAGPRAQLSVWEMSRQSHITDHTTH